MSFPSTNSGGFNRIPSENASPARRKRGVLLINLGSPDAPTVPAVRRYLSEFLSDPAVIQLPRGLGWLNGALGRLISRLRAPSSAELYRAVWSEEGSPLISITQAQAEALRQALPRGWRVFTAMRYGQPGIGQTLREIEASGVEELVVVPMYPQFSGPTTGTAMREVYDYLKGNDHTIQVATRLSWYNDCGYVAAQRTLLEQYARSHGLTPENCYLLFSTHGLPVSYVERGDPYPKHVAQTVTLVGQQLAWPEHRMSLAFQSRFGPTQWMQPYTDGVLEKLVADGEKRILICPISFTTDCLETLEEIDIRYRPIVEDNGAELFLCPALNAFGPFITALKHLILRGCRPICGKQRSVAALAGLASNEARKPTPARSLVMVGMSRNGRLGSGRGPKLQFTDADGLRRVKRSGCEVPSLLRDLQETLGIEEAFLWNTCHRVEYYGYVNNSDDAGGIEKITSRIGQQLFGAGAEDQVNVLFDREARHHLLRTAAGLNSHLPGERDVLSQLQAAYRLSDRAQTAGPAVKSLIEDVTAAERQLRGTTDWGRFDPDYCPIAIHRVEEVEQLDLSSCRVVVIGGSTTSANICRALMKDFGVPGRQLTLLYRGHKHGGGLKQLRAAIGNGNRIRVQSYREPRVLRAICEADLVLFGTDREEILLDGDGLDQYRKDNAGPLTIIDFNTFESTQGLASDPRVRLHNLAALDGYVQAHADATCGTDGFAHAAGHAEAWIACHFADGDTDQPSAQDALGGHDAQADPTSTRQPASKTCAGPTENELAPVTE